MSAPRARLPRFTPARDSIWAMHLTPRDAEIIRLVSRHRFVRSNQIISFVGGSPQQLLRRLQLLFHHGYLDRPRFNWNDRNQSVKQLYLQHTLLMSDVMVAFENGCVQNRGVRLVREAGIGRT